MVSQKERIIFQPSVSCREGSHHQKTQVWQSEVARDEARREAEGILQMLPAELVKGSVG